MPQVVLTINCGCGAKFDSIAAGVQHAKVEKHTLTIHGLIKK